MLAKGHWRGEQRPFLSSKAVLIQLVQTPEMRTKPLQKLLMQVLFLLVDPAGQALTMHVPLVRV